MDERWKGSRFFGADTVGGFDQMPRFGKPRFGIVLQRAQRLASLPRIAHSLVKLQAHRGIDLVFLLFTAAAQYHAGNTQLFALDRCDITSRPTGDGESL